MARSEDVQSRLELLRSDLKGQAAKYLTLARINYHFAYALMILTLLFSVAAGIGGIFLPISKEVVGGLALVPGVFALVANMLKPQGRANWHYRKHDELNELLRRASFDLPASPSASDVAKIARAWSKVDKDMSLEWENKFSLDWSQFQNKGEPK